MTTAQERGEPAIDTGYPPTGGGSPTTVQPPPIGRRTEAALERFAAVEPWRRFVPADRLVDPEELAALESIQRRVLWLATNIVDHANRVRPNPDRTKVGGHQASTASVVSILTALYFKFLRAGDRVSIKPHASPGYHAVQYLLGNLAPEYLTTLRDYQGLQAYPSRTKDPDPVDFSTGSVGLGAVAPCFAALAHTYAAAHFGPDAVTSDRFIALIGDAELDEGNVWEAVNEEALRGLGNVIWIVDLNRQSLDRIIPGIRAAQLKALFAASGWHVFEAKYGRRLQAAFARPGGEALCRRIDAMSNEEYQTLIRLPGQPLRRRAIEGAPEADRDALAAVLAEVPDADLPGLFADLGGHDLVEVLGALAAADAVRDAPAVVFAYTVKGWGLPFAGDALNHAALLSAEQMRQVQQRLGVRDGEEWAGFPPDSPEGRLIGAAAERLRRPPLPPPAVTPAAVPATLDFRPPRLVSTQEAFGRLVSDLATVPELGRRIVTVSPDVSVSTNLGGWINRVGVWARAPQPIYDPDPAAPKLLRWQPGPAGRHIELGISEMNLFMCLGAFGLAHQLCGQQLLPIGTVYDPFVLRGLDALIHGLYQGAKMIVVGTPSGISLSPEGGAHQSTVTPSLGIELPGLLSYEPCFAREVEWTLLEALRRCCARGEGAADEGLSTYLRLSTKPIDQTLLDPALSRIGEAELRRQVLQGGYRLIDHRLDAADLGGEDVVHIAVSGAMVPEAVEAARALHREGVAANVLAITSLDQLYRSYRAALASGAGHKGGHLGDLIPPEERAAPIVTVLDGASHAAAFLGSVFGQRLVPLGVDDFGQSGSRAALYRHYGIDAQAIVEAAVLALDTAT